MFGGSWVLEGAVLSHCLQPGRWAQSWGGIRGEVRERKKKKKLEWDILVEQ